MGEPNVFEVDRRMEPGATSIARRCALAGIAGAVLGVTAAFNETLATLPTLLHMLISLMAGCTAAVALAPWGAVHKASRQRQAIATLQQRVHRFAQQRGNMRLEELLLDHEDVVSELSSLIHELASETISTRRQARAVQRRLGEDVRRETQRVTAELVRQATTDALTGLGNRRALEQAVERCAGASRDATMVIMLIDVDRFKEINDSLGHAVGDRCLVFLGHLLKASVQECHCAIRLGGDEFALFMPESTIESAQLLAERLSSLYAQMPWPHTGTEPPTLSIGVAAGCIGGVKDINDLLRQADAALYASKRAGRARVRTHRGACPV